MGALKGSIAVRRYAVTDALPRDARARFSKGVRAHAFLPLDPKAEADRSAGWVSILDADDADLDAGKLFFAASGGEQLRLSLRIDVLRAPGGEVKRQTIARAREVEAQEGRQLSRSEKRLLKEEVTRTLRLRAFPRTSIIDVVWNLDEKRIWLWSQSKATNELFLDLFAKSFAINIDVEGATRWANAAADPRRIALLEPTPELWTGFAGVRPLGNVVEDEAA